MEEKNMSYRLFIVFFAICLAGHILRSIYEILKAKNRINPKNKIVFALMFINMGLLWVSWFRMCELDPVKLPVPGGLRVAGLVLFAAGVLLFVITVVKLKALENTDRLVQDGIFAVLRHPMYLGFIFWIVGFAVLMQAQTALLTAFIWIPNILFWRSMEERHLETEYREYGAYKKRTFF